MSLGERLLKLSFSGPESRRGLRNHKVLKKCFQNEGSLLRERLKGLEMHYEGSQ